jgi:hypothetical protein
MKTYQLDLRHAPSKNRLNALDDNRLPPLRLRLADDVLAIDWAKEEALQFVKRNRGPNYTYVEAALTELLPIGAAGDDDYRRVGRWVHNRDGLNWRPTPKTKA